MDLRWLEDVLVLLEEGNMTRAANRRNITQPAFSRRIRGFEDWLGTPVLDRKVNRVDLSPSLAANEPEIRALAARIQELRGRISTYDPQGATTTIAAQHASIYSTFPDMALRARKQYPSVRFRVRAGNQRDCVSMFLRGDASMLLFYEAEGAAPLPFGDTVKRGTWGEDRLVPVVGGSMRYAIARDGSIPDDSPAIIYPEESHFGVMFKGAEKRFATRSQTINPVYETAFSNGIRELVLKGLGIAWLPVSMTHQEIESGRLVSLAGYYGSLALNIALYADMQDDTASTLLETWSA
ncbi:MAG: LysR family transcriptional regulator [Pseudomonadota bacterium]